LRRSLALLRAIRRLLPALGRHAAGYASLIGAEAGSALAIIRRRLILGIATFLIAWLSIVVGLVWLVAAVWDTPYRLWLLGGLTIGLALIAMITAAMMMRGSDELFRKVRAEWAADRELLRQIGSSLTEDRRA
jgi:uncharacterized membrane protein YqjE